MITYKPYYRIYNTKGRLAWLYNPLRNYRLDKDRYKLIWLEDGAEKFEYFTDLGKVNEYLNKNFSGTYEIKNKENEKKEIVDGEFTGELPENSQLIKLKKYLLVDFDTEELNFKITNPISIVTQPSYDGSVNLILNDGINTPKLINTRFSPTGNDTYEIIDRKGNDDTNIYDAGVLFNIDTSLYKQLDKIQEIEFLGTSVGGRLQVGNYHFYFKLMDADGNESDFIGQSGLVSLFIGSGVKSAHTGTKNELSHKIVRFLIKNIDVAYPYVSVYYSRASAEGTEMMAVEYKKVLKKFLVSNAGTASVTVTGFELAEDISERDINIFYNIVDRAKTATQNQNMLFLGNVRKAEIPYTELTALSLQFTPVIESEEYDVKMTEKYGLQSTNKGYFDVGNINKKVGYWPNEYYRLGIVYIMKSGELSPVFNIRGALNIRNNTQYLDIPVHQKGTDKIKTEILYSETNYIIQDPDCNYEDPTDGKVYVHSEYENIKGVVKISKYANEHSDFDIINILIKLQKKDEVLTELRKYCKGFFFVRQKRIPTVLAQGLSIGIEDESHLPMLPVSNDTILKNVIFNNKYNHLVYAEDTINYITEGFLTRYTLKFKSKGGLLNKIGSAVLIGIGAALVVVGSIVTAGAAGIITGGILATIATSTTAIAAATIIATAVGAVVATATTLAAETITLTVLLILRATSQKVANGWSTKAPSGYKIIENTDKSRLLGGKFQDRIIIKNPNIISNKALICPEYTVNQPYFNSIFTGNDHTLVPDQMLPVNRYLDNKRDRHFYVGTYSNVNPDTSDKTNDVSLETIETKVLGVPEGVSIVGIGDLKFRSKAGEAEEAFRFQDVGNEYKLANPIEDGSEEDIEAEVKNKKINSDIVRGIFSSYLGCSDDIGVNYLYNIMIPNYSDGEQQSYLNLRAEDNSPFYCVTRRYDINNDDSEFKVYSGDCYICLYTLRIIRNFNSPSLPYNDEILDNKSWQINYDPNNKEKYSLINLGDVNAVLLGMWVTFRLRSSMNLNIRTIDESYVDEVALSGHPRAYFPIHPMDPSGSYKISESQVYNQGFTKSVGEQYQYELQDSPWIKNWFGTRIMYSDIHINDAFRNGFRVFRPTTYRDYTREYGTITKLLSIGLYIIAVMEHGILRIAIDPSNITTDSFINYKNVLQENPDVISKDYGSEWQDSIIQTPSGIYGVDTHAKKIWKTDGQSIELISENLVLRFLNENIILNERDKTPILGRRNVKTIYNLFKNDVMFTFYNIKDHDEVAWNLCYNEKMLRFITFYSWIPSFMENINNIPFSFDRDTSKVFSILCLDGNVVKLTNPIYTWSNDNFISDLTIDYFEGYTCTIKVNDSIRLGKFFEIKENKLYFKGDERPDRVGFYNVPLTLTVNATYDKLHSYNKYQAEDDSVSATYNIIVLFVEKKYYNKQHNNFWLHGKAGIIDNLPDIKPTMWYNKPHPFEFEFVVADNIQYLKIFDNLEIISNHATPESFHYEVVGDCYDFSNDKLNMYYRLEALKYIYNYNGSNISYDPDYRKLKPSRNKRSADFPKTYYVRQDKLHQIYDDYVSKKEVRLNGVYDSYKTASKSHNFEHLAGAEVVWYKLENEFRIWNHAKAVDLDTLSLDDARSIIAANCKYLEDKWVVTINPIIVCYKNESELSWEIKDENGKVIDKKPPIAIYNSPFPEDMTNNVVPDSIAKLDTESWLSSINVYGTEFGLSQNRKETDVRGRYVKIRIRYSGKELAIIDFINTLYRISHA